MVEPGTKVLASWPGRIRGRPPAAERSEMVLPGIQILRAVAALAVVVHHTLEESYTLIGPAGALRWLVLIGASGVDLFFVISGFIMLHTQQGRASAPGTAGRFLVRRITRIVPMYWLCTSAIILLHQSGLLFTSTIVTPRTIARWLAIVPSDTPILSVGWTLSFEMYFYILFSVFLAIRSRAASLVAVAVLVAIVVTAGSMSASDAARAFVTDPIALEFCLGLFAAALFAHSKPSGRDARVALIVGCLGLLAGSLLAPSHGTAGLDRGWRFLVWGGSAALLLWSALRSSRPQWFAGRLLLLAGDASYSIYLTHPFVMIAYARIIRSGVLKGAPVTVVAGTVVLISAGLGAGTYLLVERRIERWLKRVIVDRSRPRSRDVPHSAGVALSGR